MTGVQTCALPISSIIKISTLNKESGNTMHYAENNVLKETKTEESLDPFPSTTYLTWTYYFPNIERLLPSSLLLTFSVASMLAPSANKRETTSKWPPMTA